MKMVTIAGNVGKDAQVRQTNSGDAVAGFAVAVDDGRGDNKRTIWFDVSIWGKRGEAIAPHIRKGGKVTVVGELSTREHEGRTYLTVRASEIALQGSRNDGGSGGSQGGGYSAPRTGGAPSGGGMDDDIPFAPEVR